MPAVSYFCLGLNSKLKHSHLLACKQKQSCWMKDQSNLCLRRFFCQKCNCLFAEQADTRWIRCLLLASCENGLEVQRWAATLSTAITSGCRQPNKFTSRPSPHWLRELDQWCALEESNLELIEQEICQLLTFSIRCDGQTQRCVCAVESLHSKAFHLHGRISH